MSKPLKKKLPGAVVQFVAKGDEYTNPDTGRVSVYEASKIVLVDADQARQCPRFALSRELFEALVTTMDLPEVKEKLKDW